MIDVRIVTCSDPPIPDPDQAPVLAALAARGLTADVQVWTDPTVDWTEARLTVIRSTWDYFHQVERFAEWLRRVAPLTQLENPAAIVLNNIDKHYMAALEAQGVPVVPSRFVDRGDAVDALPIPAEWVRCVVKPTVSGGSLHTRVQSRDAPDLPWLNARLAERDMMIQPYLPSVEGYGERSLVWLDGELSHVIRKGRRFDVDPESITGPFDATAAERAVAVHCLDAAGCRDLLYARVDLAPGPDGSPLVMELEVTEPSLFLGLGGATERFADAIAARVG